MHALLIKTICFGVKQRLLGTHLYYPLNYYKRSWGFFVA